MKRGEPTIILVPSGAEHRAIVAGLTTLSNSRKDFSPPFVIDIPIGPEAVQHTLNGLKENRVIPTEANVLLLGLGGSLVTDLDVGAIAVLKSCVATWHHEPMPLEGDPTLLEWLTKTLNGQATPTLGVTSQRLICSTTEKAKLHEQSRASVVDMEGYSVMKFCQDHGLRSAVLRVISDGCTHDVPDINAAITPDGTLKTRSMALEFLRHPISAVQLIRGSLTGLKILRTVVQQLFNAS